MPPPRSTPRAPFPGFRVMTMGRYFASPGKPRPLPWRSPCTRAETVHLERMGRDACPRNQARAGTRRSRHRRDLLPALAGDAGETGRRQRRRDIRYPAPLSRCLGSCRRPYAARFADRTEAGGFWAGAVRLAWHTRGLVAPRIHQRIGHRWKEPAVRLVSLGWARVLRHKA